MKAYLEALVTRYERPAFIGDDPISIPHAFSDPEDRAVVGLYAALLAWGRRATTLNKMGDLCARMRHHPATFVRQFCPERDAPCLKGFKHRTFSDFDAVILTRNLAAVLNRYGTMESAFSSHLQPDDEHVGPAIEGFSEALLNAYPDTPARLRKHVARPSTGSACKRLAMYLRWMVRPGPVDFGMWTSIHPRQLVLPLDVHSGRVARALGLLTRTQDDWKAVLELTGACRALSPDDPARYDYAFFGSGVNSGSTTSPILR